MDIHQFHDEEPPVEPYYGGPDNGPLPALILAAASQDLVPVFKPNVLKGRINPNTLRTRQDVLAALAVNRVIRPIDYLPPAF